MAVDTPPIYETPGAAILAERAVLGAMLYSPEDAARAFTFLQPSDFHHVSHQRVFTALTLAQGAIPVIAYLEARRELEMVGGAEAVFSLLDAACASQNLEPNALIIRASAEKRRSRHLAWQAQRAAEDPSLPNSAALEIFAQALENGRPAVGTSRFADAAVDAQAFTALEIPRPRSLLGDGILVVGGFAILYGKPSLGKSWLGLQLATAMVRGEPWMGIPTNSAGIRTGVIQLELGAYGMQQRLKTIGVGSHGRDQGLKIVCRPHLKGILDLYRQAGDLAALRQWIVQDKLELVIIDALSRAHTANENKAEEMGAVLSALDVIRHETGCAIVLIHHETKPQEGRDKENHLDVLRGTGRLQSDPTLLMRVYQSRGLRCLIFAKVSDGSEPSPVYYHIRDDGLPEIVKSPESISDENREKVFSYVTSAESHVTRAQISEATGIKSTTTIKRHLLALIEQGRIISVGENKATRYWGTGPPDQPDQNTTRSGVSDDATDMLDESWH